MLKATYNDRERIVDILSKSFADNGSVNYIIPQDAKRLQRIRSLMYYSFDTCFYFGEVFISSDKNGCALVVSKKKHGWRSVVLDFKLVVNATGIRSAIKAAKREAKVKQLHPSEPIYYLWFIGVDPADQHKGTGSMLLKELIARAALLNVPMYLETSTVKNIPWYEKMGFTMYNHLDLGYKLYFFRK